MTHYGCTGCSTVYRLRITRCPRCHSTDLREVEMPKIRRIGGVTIAASVAEVAIPTVVAPANLPTTEGAEREHPGADEASADSTEAEPAADEETEGGEQPSPGSSSSTSSPRQQKSSGQSKSSSRKPARTTENPSGPARTEHSTARTAAGNQTDESDKTPE